MTLKKRSQVLMKVLKNGAKYTYRHADEKLIVFITDNKKFKERLTDLEYRNRRNNIRLNGIVENDDENP